MSEPPARVTRPLERVLLALAGLLIAAALGAKLWFARWILTHCESAAPWHYLCADIAPWADFLAHTAAGAVPYVDFAREYPVGAGTLFWALGSALGARDFAGTLALQVGLSLAADLGSAALLYRLAREHDRLLAPWAVLLWLGLPSCLIVSPLRYESCVALCLLGGHALDRRGRPMPAVAVWSLGVSLKWYPVLAIAAQQLAASPAERRRTVPRAAAVFGAVMLLTNGPYMVGDLFAHGHLEHWASTYLFHAERRLAPDTVLGVLSLWLGELPMERHASLLSVAAAGAVLLWRRPLGWAPRVAMACIALVVLNRIYSPQFNLWFYPPLLLAMAAARRVEFVAAALFVGLLDLVNVAVFPFVYAGVAHELGGFEWGVAPWTGGPATELFTTLVIVRALMLLVMLTIILRLAAPQAGPAEPGPAESA